MYLNVNVNRYRYRVFATFPGLVRSSFTSRSKNLTSTPESPRSCFVSMASWISHFNFKHKHRITLAPRVQLIYKDGTVISVKAFLSFQLISYRRSAMNGHSISTRMSYSCPTVLPDLTSQCLRTSSAGFSVLLESRNWIVLLSILSLSANSFQWSSAENS